FGEKCGNECQAEQRTHSQKHFVLPSWLGVVGKQPALQGKVPFKPRRRYPTRCQARDFRRVAGSSPLSLEALPALAAMVAASGRPGGTSRLPPTHATRSSASHSAAVAWVMPPVGQKRQ